MREKRNKDRKSSQFVFTTFLDQVMGNTERYIVLESHREHGEHDFLGRLGRGEDVPTRSLKLGLGQGYKTGYKNVM